MATSQVNPSIILNTTPPQNQLQTIEGLSALKSQQYDNQLKLQQSADIAQQAQQRQLDLQDQQTVQKAMADPAINAKVHTGDFSDLEGKIQPKTLDTIRQSQTAYQEKVQGLTEGQNKIRQDALKQVSNAIEGLKTLPDAASINTALPGTIHYLQSAGVLKNAGIDPNNVPQAISDPSQLDVFQAHIGGALAAHEQALADKKTEAETEASASTATKNKADAELAQQKAAIQKQWADKFKANPAAGSQIIDQILGNDPAAAGFKAALAATPSVEAGQEIIKAATSHMAQRQEQLDPAIAAAQVNLAARKAGATAAAEVGPHVQEAVAKQLAIAKASPDLFSSIADPVARRQAEEGYTKISLDAQQQVSDAKRLQEFVQAAQSGNKAAGGLIPIEDLRQIVNRVNGWELKQAGTPGNLADKAIGALNGYINGVPFSGEGLKAISDLSQIQEANTLKNYQSKVGVMSQVYGSPKLKPLDLQGNYERAKGLNSAPVPYVDKGTTYRIPPDKVADFLKDHPGAQKQ